MNQPRKESPMAEPRIAEMTFAVALARERQRFQTTVKNIADGIGVSYDEYRKYESGETIPDRQTFRRLTGRWPRLRAYRPAWGAADTIDGAPVIVDELAVVPPPVQTFGQALARVREANDLSQQQLGEILGVSGQAVGQWELDLASPITEHLNKLYEVMWEIRVAVECGSALAPSTQDIPKPGPAPGGQRVVSIVPLRADPAAAVMMATQQSDAEALVRPVSTIHRPSSREWADRDHPFVPNPIVDHAPHDPLSEIRDLGVAIAMASFAKAEAERDLAALIANVDRLKKNVVDAQGAIDAANLKLHLAIERKTRV